ncbi:MAG: tetratricopeptide repeat protein [Bacteroidota bacterium]
MRIFGGLVLISFLLLLPIRGLYSQIPPAGNSASLAEEQDYAFAYGLYSDGLFQLASVQFDTFLEKYPASLKRLDAFFLSVESRFQQQQFDTAAKLFARFLADYPSSRLSDDAYLRMGESYLRLNKPESALPSFKKVLDNFGSSELAGEAAYWIGDSYVRMSDYENGIKYYMLAFEHYPKSRLRDYALYAVGWAYQTKGEYALAVDWYKRLPGQFPESDLISASLVRIGECYYSVREYRKAIEELSYSRKGITRPAEQGEAEYLIGEAHYHLAEYDAARRWYEDFLKNHPDHKLTRDVVYALGWTYLKLNNFLLAEATFDRMSSGNDATAFSALFRRGVAERLGGKSDEALTTWGEVLKQDPLGESTDNALYETGLVLFERNDYAGALAFFQRVTREFPASDVLADSYRMTGECLVAQSDFRAAKEAFAKTVGIKDVPFDTRANALYQLGWSQYKMEQRKEAIQSFGQFLQEFANHPKTPDAQFWRAEAAYQEGSYEAALEDYDAVTRSSSAKKPDAWYGAGYSLFKGGRYKDAASRFERLVTDFPSSRFGFDARVRLADCYFFLRDYRGAEGAYRTVLRQFADRNDRDYAMYQLGQTYFRLNNYEDALRQFQGVVGMQGSLLADDAQYAIGWLWFQGKNYDEAVNEFRNLIRKFPQSDLIARAHYSIGDALFNQQNYASAEQSYREVLRKFPQSPLVVDAISGIQYCLLAQGKQQEALSIIDAYVKENPGSPEAQSLLLKKGDLLFSQKQFDAAIKEYRGFADRYSQSPLLSHAWYWIGRSYEGMTRLLDAANAFERAASFEDGAVRIRAEAYLQAGEAYRALKSYEKSRQALAQAEKLSSGSELSLEAIYLQGKVSEESGDLASAIRLYNTLIARSPGSLPSDKARVALAQMYVRETNYSEAKTLAEQVATSRTDQLGAEAQYLIGLQFSQQGDWANAIPAYLRVRYIFPAHEEWLAKAYLNLGEAYEVTDDVRRAKEAYQSVVKMERQASAVAEARKRLRRMERP